MTEAVRQQLAAHGAIAAPKRTSGRGAGERSASPRKTSKSDHSDEMDKPQIQAARREVVGVGLLAWENPVFGLPCHYRKYRLLDKAQAEELDKEFYRITGATPT